MKDKQDKDKGRLDGKRQGTRDGKAETKKRVVHWTDKILVDILFMSWVFKSATI